MLNVCHLVARFIISVTSSCMAVFRVGLMLVITTLTVDSNKYYINALVFILMFINAVYLLN